MSPVSSTITWELRCVGELLEDTREPVGMELIKPFDADYSVFISRCIDIFFFI